MEKLDSSESSSSVSVPYLGCWVFMRIRISIFILSLFCISHIAIGAPAKFKNETEFFATISDFASDRTDIKKGDLTGDGRPDMVVLLGRGKEFSDRTHQLVILVQEADGLYRLAASSVETVPAGMGCCWVEWLEIKNGSVFIQNNAKTACDIEAATHQFKLHRGKWRLIGLKIVYYKHCDDPQVTTIKDFNLLTGKAIYTNETDGKQTKAISTKNRASVHLLNDYDFYNGFGVPET